HLFHLPKDQQNNRITDLLQRFDLHDVLNQKPDSLPLGVKQRLQLAVAILHQPEVLILDEPTSGVDPIARDDFWQLLIELSRDEGVTIFISTHFMNEASRCDRISLMHAGKVLAVGAPQDLADARHAASLDEAFVAYLEDAMADGEPDTADPPIVPEPADTAAQARHNSSTFSVRRMWAYASREAKELLRDRIRLAFALLGPVILMITFGYGISFDVEELPYAGYDQDRSRESRQFLENFSSSRYFVERPPIARPSAVETRLKSGELTFAIEIPSGFGKDLLKGEQPEVGVWLDGAMPFRAETTRGYIQGVTLQYIADMSTRQTGRPVSVSPVSIETRFRYNQAFKSTYAIIPGVIMLLCVLIPSMMTAVGIVREKEMGSITNLYSTPVTRMEFLLGKQLPYIAIAYASFVSLCVLVILVFAVPLKGSLLALATGALIYVWATTGFGMLVSSFVNSQIAAIFATAILAMVPTMNFSGFMTPVSALGGGAKVTSALFPASYFQQISVGSFTKALSFADLWSNHLFLIGFGLGFFLIATVFLRKQDV
ncbi:MAG: ABC transporter ATP-binding protein/permease, partial [Anderseniella sp.]|nr:ABC transporter ATP-binding protein/permease [Anderseniella sp.]